MIFRRTLYKELARTAVAVFLVLLAITFTTLLIRLLGQAASGSFAAEAVLAFLGFSVLNNLSVLLSLTLFIAVLMTIIRSYRDSEMIVWFSSGLSLTAWVRPVVYFSAPLILAIAVLSLFLSPWSLLKSEELRQQIETRDDVAMIAPGVFKESKHADRVYFVESFAGPQNTVRNIFMQSLQHDKLGIMFSEHGYQATEKNGDRFLVFLDGRRYEGVAGSPEYKVLEFGRYAMRIEPFEAKMLTVTPKSLSTAMLIQRQSPENSAELVWRIGLPISAMILVLLAIPLAFANPRAGRSWSLILALLIYMVYSNLLSISQAWVAQQKLSPSSGLWGVHVAMLVLMLFLFYRRLYFAPSLHKK